MKITFDGNTYQYDPRKVSVQTAATVTRETGLRWPLELEEALKVGDPVAVQALLWLVRQQNGHVESFADVDGSMLDFIDSYVAALNAEAEIPVDPPQAAPDGGDSPTTTSVNSEISTS